jgi:hypothetical protein
MQDSRYRAKLTLALGTIYLVWGSSFLFSRFWRISSAVMRFRAA